MTKDKVVIRAHWDADGITSAYFASYGIPNSVIEFKEGEFGDTTGLKKGDWMVDMRPNTNMEGLNVIDHHLPHKYKDIKYNATLDEVPASLIAWRKFKDDIPKSEWWKLAIGLVGDGQPELIPPEVFEECPQLLTKIKTSAYQSYGKWNIGYYPVYKLLSSYVNAHLRKGEFTEALNLMRYSQTPVAILHSLKAKAAKASIKAEFENIVKTADSYQFDDLVVFLYNSNYRMSGYMASSLQNSFSGKTIMAIDRGKGRGSLRGDLCHYWQDKLKHLEYLILDGHPGFFGVTCTVNTETLIEDIIKSLQ